MQDKEFSPGWCKASFGKEIPCPKNKCQNQLKQLFTDAY